MNTSNSTSCEPVHPTAHIFFISIYSLIFLVGLFLNGFTLRVYFCRPQRRASSSVTIYLKNLAASDFLISLCLPIRIMNYASNSVDIRLVYCNFGASAFYLNMYASIMFMGYIAANRYIKIIHPLGNHTLLKTRTAFIISIATWSVLVAMTITYMILSLSTQERQDHLPGMVSCDVLHSKQLNVLYKVIHCFSGIIFIFFLASLVYLYNRTSHRLAQAQENQPASSSSKKLAKSRRNMLVLVSVFCVCFVPYHLVRLPYAFMKHIWCSFSWFFYLKEMTIVVSVLNVCLDPLIYFIFCKAFRAQMSLKPESNTVQVASEATVMERRSSEGRQSFLKNPRKLSLPLSTSPTDVL
ncbi:P2Y purinoceptor 14 isoform X2 [Nothobranchius furzeri]|uniref:P2Y purinoceptor 14-like n=2 Tax=Nothobranchius furzeri TaxID=105023 RepID=A0A9D3BTS2_NOTFU|nr:P2Y purinoceptor 14 isoform X2 [Nothobranchius furzeri]KAF7218348.1 P2Y purinoceptor 14-like [Nothobranchius furzeri]